MNNDPNDDKQDLYFIGNIPPGDSEPHYLGLTITNNPDISIQELAADLNETQPQFGEYVIVTYPDVPIK